MDKKEYQRFFTPYHFTNALLNVTDQCNLRCRYCFTEHNPHRMSLDTAKKAIEFLWNNRGTNKEVQITFFGGEPMLEYDTIIVPLVNWVKTTDMNIKFGMTTNGTLFTEERLQWLYDNKIGFLLSIDGDKFTQDYNRPCANCHESSFDKVAAHIPKILELFPDTTFRSTAIPDTMEHIVDSYLFARKCGFNRYYIMPNVMEKWTLEQIAYYNYQIGTIYDIFYRDVSAGVSPLEINNIMKTYEAYFGYERNFGLAECTRCGLGTSSIGIGHDGAIWGCQEHSTYSDKDIFYIGNIFDGIDEDRHIALLEAFCSTVNLIPEDPKMCENCIRKRWCAMLHCPSHNFINFGDIRKQDKMTCLYRMFEDAKALQLLEQAEKDNNQMYYLYVMHNIKARGGKRYAM